jgi:hypothetical protein
VDTSLSPIIASLTSPLREESDWLVLFERTTGFVSQLLRQDEDSAERKRVLRAMEEFFDANGDADDPASEAMIRLRAFCIGTISHVIEDNPARLELL